MSCIPKCTDEAAALAWLENAGWGVALGPDIALDMPGAGRADYVDSVCDGESFFVRHAYFLGASDPYSALRTTLKAEIDPEAWATLNCDTSRPFPKPKSGRTAVKVINHLGDE